MKLTVTNTSQNPSFVHTTTGPHGLEPKETVTADFSDGEAAALAANVMFDVSGYTDPKTGVKSVSKNAETAELTANLESAHAELTNARANLKAIADLFGTPDVDELNVHSAVERLIQDAKPKAPTLAEAVASLDDKNDAHWTKAGHPSIAALKDITKSDVSADDLDAITPPRVRK